MPETNERTAQEAELEALRKAASNQEPESTTPAETAPAEEEGLSTESQPDNSIPEKFRGKTAIEIADAYRNLERQYGKIVSEKSHSEKVAEETRARLAALEASMTQRQQQPPVAAEPSDPFAGFDEQLEADPKAALKKLVDYVRETPKQLRSDLSREQRAQLATDYYQRQMKDNPEFRELEPQMQRLAVQHGRMIHPDHINTPETMELLFKLAKSENMSSYEKRAAEKAIQANNLVRDEKRRAVSESASGGSAGASVPFEELSLAEQRKLLGVIDR